MRAILLLSALVISCAPAEEPDDFSDESDLLDEGKADHGSRNYGYFLAWEDARRCVSPLCGGTWVARVNRDRTRCSDGGYREACYVADLDLGETGLGESERAAVDEALFQGRALLRGWVRSQVYENFGELGRFEATEAWIDRGDGFASGVFARVTDTGVRCATYPCPSYDEEKLNSDQATTLAAVDLGPAHASETAEAAAWEAMTRRQDGLIVSGYRYSVYGPAGKGKGRRVTQFYTRVVAAPASDCVVSGCSGHVCADHDVVTTCEWRPEYACYQDARCERQADGECGWTQTAGLLACLGDGI